MGFGLKRRQRVYYKKKFCCSLALLLLCGVFFYEGIKLYEHYDQSIYLFASGALCAIGLLGLLAMVLFSLLDLSSLLLAESQTKRSMTPYLEDGDDLGDPYRILDGDLFKDLGRGIFLGDQWLVFRNQAMKRNSIVGVFFQRHFKRGFSTLTVVDESGRQMQAAYSDRDGNLFDELSQRQPGAASGNVSKLLEWKEKAGEIPAGQEREVYGTLRSRDFAKDAAEEDHSAVLEDNLLRNNFERWLLATYALYVEDDPDGDFAYAGGYRRTESQRDKMVEVLKSPWEVLNREELLMTASEMMKCDANHPARAWQYCRATMILAFGYIAGMITREEMLISSYPVAMIIQKSFHNWTEMCESHMIGFENWVKRTSEGKDELSIIKRRNAYYRLLNRPDNVLKFPFGANLDALYQEAVGGPQESCAEIFCQPNPNTSGFILFEKRDISPHLLEAEITQRFGPEAITQTDFGDPSVFTMNVRLEGIDFWCSYVPFPVPKEEMDLPTAVQRNRLSPDEREAISGNRSFLLIAQKDGGKTLEEKRRVCVQFSRLCGGLMELDRTVGFCLNTTGLLVSRREYLRHAAILNGDGGKDPDYFPAPLWIWVLSQKQDSAPTVETIGLREFGFMELQFFRPRQDFAEVCSNLYLMAVQEITGKAHYKNQETITYPGDRTAVLKQSGEKLSIIGA